MKRAHQRADQTLFRKETKINNFYNRQYKKINREFLKFYEKHKELLEKKLHEYKNKEITKEEYRSFIIQNIYLSDEWQRLVDKLVDMIIKTNISSLTNIVNKKMTDIYIYNYNNIIKSIGMELLDEN